MNFLNPSTSRPLVCGAEVALTKKILTSVVVCPIYAYVFKFPTCLFLMETMDPAPLHYPFYAILPDCLLDG